MTTPTFRLIHVYSGRKIDCFISAWPHLLAEWDGAVLRAVLVRSTCTRNNDVMSEEQATGKF